MFASFPGKEFSHGLAAECTPNPQRPSLRTQHALGQLLRLGYFCFVICKTQALASYYED